MCCLIAVCVYLLTTVCFFFFLNFLITRYASHCVRGTAMTFFFLLAFPYRLLPSSVSVTSCCHICPHDRGGSVLIKSPCQLCKRPFFICWSVSGGCILLTRWMNGRVDWWVDQWMVGLINRWMNYRSMNKWIFGWMNELKDQWMHSYKTWMQDRWINGWTDGWMDGYSHSLLSRQQQYLWPQPTPFFCH